MLDWNVVINLNQRGYRRAFSLLRKFGPVGKTDFFNVLVMEAEDIPGLLENLQKIQSEDPAALSFLSRLIPLTRTFSFRSPEDFEEKSREVVLAWAPELAGKGFHVRMHRRGFKGRLSSLDEEHFLDHVLLEALEKTGTPGRITFDDPDAIVAVETIGQRAGLSLWTREELRRYPFIRLDS